MSSVNGKREAVPACDPLVMIMINRWRTAALGSFAVAAAAMGIASATASADPGGDNFAESPNAYECPPRSGLLIHIIAGDIDCVTAADFAVQYDQYGDKFQVIGPFTCYSGNAMTQPLLYQCVSEGPPAEFAVYGA